jgi:hypothetical protein
MLGISRYRVFRIISPGAIPLGEFPKILAGNKRIELLMKLQLSPKQK